MRVIPLAVATPNAYPGCTRGAQPRATHFTTHTMQAPITACMLILAHAAAAAQLSRCDQLRHAHGQYVTDDPCPNVLLESTAAFRTAFVPDCGPLKQRACISNHPPHYIPPMPSFRSNPPEENVNLNTTDAKYTSFDALAARPKGDCAKCWQFVSETHRWRTYINTIERILSTTFWHNPLYRTVLDIGAGTGGFLAEITRRGVAGIGIVRDWQHVPYMQTAAARGIITLYSDFRNTMPFSNDAFDVLHCARLFNVIQDTRSISNMLYEWDRVVRPGGLVIQYGYRSPNFTKYTMHIQTTATKILRWRQRHWQVITAMNSTILFFIYSTPS